MQHSSDDQDATEIENTSQKSNSHNNTKKQSENENIEPIKPIPKKLDHEKLKEVLKDLLEPKIQESKNIESEIDIASESEDQKVIELIPEEIDLNNSKYDEIVKKHKKALFKITAFNIFEKEKCKNVNFKEIDLRQYISGISKIWRSMDDKKKEKYVKMSNEAKEEYEKTLSGEELKIFKALNNKRKKSYSTKKTKKIKNFSLNKLKKLKPRKAKKEIEVLTLDEDSDVKMDSVDLCETTFYKKDKNKNKQNQKNKKEKIKNDFDEAKEDEESSINNIKNNQNILQMKDEMRPETFNLYLNSVLMPFIADSYQFLKNNISITGK